MNLFASALLSLSIMGCALLDNDVPANKVPSVVKNAFAKEYPNPVGVEWEKKKGDYEADFEIENVDHSALFNSEGQLLMAKQKIRESDLPPAVIKNITESFPGHYFDELGQIKTEGKVYYQVELEKTVRDRKIVFSQDGQVDQSFKYWD